MNKVMLFPNSDSSLEDVLLELVDIENTDTLCVITAFLSLDGAKYLQKIAEKSQCNEFVAIVGVSGQITQPNALSYLATKGWKVRIGVNEKATFHPKMLVIGEGYSSELGLKIARGFYIGSANITKSAFSRNTEVGFFTKFVQDINGINQVTQRFWRESIPLSDTYISEYSEKFSEKMKTVDVKDLIELGYIENVMKTSEIPREVRIPAKEENLPIQTNACLTVWVGLRSTTGIYKFQVEVPKNAAKILKTMLPERQGAFQVNSSGQEFTISYSFYTDNGMFRLNLPNDFPNVREARDLSDGYLIISKSSSDVSAKFDMKIVFNQEIDEFTNRSFALDTWGQTSTRLYGWY